MRRRRAHLAVAATVALLLTAVAGFAGLAPKLVITAPQELAAAAERVRAVGESDFAAIARLTGIIGFARPIEVVLVSDRAPLAQRTPQWIAGYAEGARRRIVLFPDRVPSYPDGNLANLVRHEVAHVAIDEAAGGNAVPRWFHEGLATVAAREWGLEDRARYALAVVGRRERSTADLDRDFVEGGARVARAYALSSAFVRDLIREHGPDVTAAILAEVAVGHRFPDAFRRATGDSLRHAEHVFFGARAFWTTWVPFLTSSVFLWFAITSLALLAFRARSRRSAAIRARWEDGELEPHESLDGSGLGPVN